MPIEEVPNNINKEIIKAIENAVKSKADEIYEQKKEEAIEKFDKIKDEVLAGITLHIMKRMDIQSFGDRIVITLITNDGK